MDVVDCLETPSSWTSRNGIPLRMHENATIARTFLWRGRSSEGTTWFCGFEILFLAHDMEALRTRHERTIEVLQATIEKCILAENEVQAMKDTLQEERQAMASQVQRLQSELAEVRS